MYGMNVSLYTTCMYDMSLHNAAHNVCLYTQPNQPHRVKASSCQSSSALLNLITHFKKYKHIAFTYQSKINSTLHLGKYMSD